MVALLVACLALLASPVCARAQVGAGGPRRIQRFRPLPAHPAGAAADSARRRLRPGEAFFLSAVLPGAGQHALGVQRWAVYAAIEAWAWLSYAHRYNDAVAGERQYHNLAWNVARRVSVGPRKDGSFAYYEAMEHFTASGAFDVDPAAQGVQPESNATTYNGQVWLLSQELYMPTQGGPYATSSPQYQAALAYYEKHAVSPGFAWSWGDNLLEQRLYSSVIHQSDQDFRTARTLLGTILANHIVSAVDALVTQRLRAMGASGLRLSSGLARRGPTHRWTFTVSFPLGGG